MPKIPTKIEIVTNKKYVDVNSSRLLDIVSVPADCDFLCDWSVDNNELATVDNVGKVRGKKQGKIVVTAAVKNHPEINPPKDIPKCLVLNTGSKTSNSIDALISG